MSDAAHAGSLRRDQVAIGLVAAMLVALEIVWTRIFSAEFFYSFALWNAAESQGCTRAMSILRATEASAVGTSGSGGRYQTSQPPLMIRAT